MCVKRRIEGSRLVEVPMDYMKKTKKLTLTCVTSQMG